MTSQPGLSPVIDCIIVNGTVSPNGTCSGSYSGGTSVTLTTSVAPGSGDSFVGWNGACTGPSPTCLIPGTAGDVNVVANFVFDACNLSTAYTIGTRVNGTLGSCQFGTGLYRDGYNFTLTGQQFFEIAVTASGFPPESRWMITPPSIWWGVWSTVSGTVAQSYLLPAGSYTFWAANHVAQDYGAYTLFSQNVSSPFFTCGQYGPVRTTFGILNAAMTLSGSACPYTASTGLVTRADPYSIYVPAGKQLTVRVTTTAFVPLIELRDGFSDQFDGALAATTAGSQTPGVLTYAPNGGAWLRIFVAAAPGAAGGGAYGLTIDP